MQAGDRDPSRKNFVRRRLKRFGAKVFVLQNNRRDVESNGVDLSSYGEVVSKDGLRATLRISKTDVSRVTARLLSELSVHDLTIEDTPIDDVIERVFAQG